MTRMRLAAAVTFVRTSSTLALALLLTLPFGVLGTASTPDDGLANLAPVDPQPQLAPCLPAPVGCVDLPLLVDESGDSMDGNLAFATGAGVSFSGGLLTGDSPGLKFGAARVCLASTSVPGCASSTLTGVLAGAGLAGGGSTGTVTLALAPGGVTNAFLGTASVDGSKVLDGSLGVADLGFDPATQAELDAHKAGADHDGRYFTEAELQSPGTLNAGTNPVDWTKLKGVPAGFADGTDDAAPRPAFLRTTVASTGQVGFDARVAIGVDGLAVIVSNDFSTADLEVAHCSDIACSTATIATVDSAGSVGRYPGVAIGADGFPLISYDDATNADLKVAHCSNVACTSATLTSLDTAGDVGRFSSTTIGSDGLGLIAYYDDTNGDLKVAHCSNTACTGATFTTLDAAGSVGVDTSITIGADALGIISYYDLLNGNLKVAHCSNTACTAATVTTIDASAGTVGQRSTLAVGTDGLGLISYYDLSNGDLKVAHCTEAACTAATLAAVDTTGDVGTVSSLTIGADGLGLLAYYDSTNGRLKVGHCTTTACGTITSVVVDTPGSTGRASSITVGADGFGLIAYNALPADDLKVTHCSDRFCVPFHRAI